MHGPSCVTDLLILNADRLRAVRVDITVNVNTENFRLLSLFYLFLLRFIYFVYLLYSSLLGEQIYPAGPYCPIDRGSATYIVIRFSAS